MSTLFNFSELKDAKIDLPVLNSFKLEKASVVLGELALIVDELRENDAVVFFTEGKFSLHNLIVSLVNEYGKANLYFTSWGLSEEPLRVIHNLQQKDLIGELYCYLDYRIRERQPKAFQFCKSISSEIGFGKSHAKLVILECDNSYITIVGSLNMTRNNKNEAGVVLKDFETGLKLKEYLNLKIDDGRAKE
jgi:hypothetical protein